VLNGKYLINSKSFSLILSGRTRIPNPLPHPNCHPRPREQGIHPQILCRACTSRHRQIRCCTRPPGRLSVALSLMCQLPLRLGMLQDHLVPSCQDIVSPAARATAPPRCLVPNARRQAACWHGPRSPGRLALLAWAHGHRALCSWAMRIDLAHLPDLNRKSFFICFSV
jgi:hypothetical protein